MAVLACLWWVTENKELNSLIDNWRMFRGKERFIPAHITLATAELGTGTVSDALAWAANVFVAKNAAGGVGNINLGPLSFDSDDYLRCVTVKATGATENENDKLTGLYNYGMETIEQYGLTRRAHTREYRPHVSLLYEKGKLLTEDEKHRIRSDFDKLPSKQFGFDRLYLCLIDGNKGKENVDEWEIYDMQIYHRAFLRTGDTQPMSARQRLVRDILESVRKRSDSRHNIRSYSSRHNIRSYSDMFDHMTPASYGYVGNKKEYSYYFNQDAFLALNEVFLKNIVAEQALKPAGVHVLLVDEYNQMLFIDEKNWEKIDMLGGAVDALDDDSVEKWKAVGDTIYGDAFVEELGIFPESLDLGRYHAGHMWAPYVDRAGKDRISLMIVLRIDRPSFEWMHKIKRQMLKRNTTRVCETRQLRREFCEMSGLNFYTLDQLIKNVVDERDRVAFWKDYFAKAPTEYHIPGHPNENRTQLHNNGYIATVIKFLDRMPPNFSADGPRWKIENEKETWDGLS